MSSGSKQFNLEYSYFQSANVTLLLISAAFISDKNIRHSKNIKRFQKYWITLLPVTTQLPF
jgi:hypothetical protein